MKLNTINRGTHVLQHKQRSLSEFIAPEPASDSRSWQRRLRRSPWEFSRHDELSRQGIVCIRTNTSAMPTLLIESIQCHATEDNNKHDELYVTLNGIRVFGPVEIANGQAIAPRVSASFQSRIKVELWDEDSWDPDDKLGEFDALDTDANKGELRKHLGHGGASYTVFYKVLL